MIRNAKYLTAICATLARLSLPAGLIVTTSVVTTGCLFSSKGPSNVSQGKLYVSGDPTYDAFFNDLYQMQVALAQAPDRERVAREKLAAAVNVAATATPQQIGEGLDKRASAMFKSGAAIKLTVNALDDQTAAPTASLSSSSQPADTSDRSLITQVTETASAEASIAADMRKARVVVERLRGQAETLEPGVDSAFRKGGLKKQAEVSKNVADAKRLLSLMSVRVDEVERAATSLLKNMSQAAHYDAPPPPAAPPPAEEDTKKKKKKKGGAASAEAPAAPAPQKPAAPAAGGAAPKPASPDFEP